MTNAAKIATGLSCGQSGCLCSKTASHGAGKSHCPAHSDNNPSLSVTEIDGVTLLKCRAGCSQDAVFAELRIRGLWADKSINGPGQNMKTDANLTRFDICDVSGETVAVHVRKDASNGKTFWWELPDGSKGLGGISTSALPLYGCEVLAALPDGTEIVVSEGEKAVEALRSKGIIAVGSVTGSAATPGNEAIDPLVRMRVVLWPDNDDAGHQHMNSIASRLSSLGCLDIRTVAWLDAPHKGDAADAVAKGVDVPKLIAEAQAWHSGDINLAEILDNLTDFCRQYVVLSDDQARAIALWTAHTHALDAADCTPYLSVQSAEKQSGKTLLLEVLSLLVARPWFTGRVTSAVLVRNMDKVTPTLLLDEADATFNGDKEYSEMLRGVLNTGYRKGGTVSMCVSSGKGFDVRDFGVFGAKALAGIGKLPDTVKDRSIPIEMHRKTKLEHAERFRYRDAKEQALLIKGPLETWAALAVPGLDNARPVLPDELDDRATDVWEPLLAIAELAGADWPKRAHQSALALSTGTSREDDSLGVKLLKDIFNVFDSHGVDRFATSALVKELLESEESPWGDLTGKTLDGRRLAMMLKPYQIRPKTIRLQDDTTPKGYRKDQFLDSWNRYFPEAATSATSATSSQPDLVDVAVVAASQEKSQWRF